MKLKKEYYNQPTLRVAKDLLGKFLIRKIGNKTIKGMITETEAYIGFKDKASHASKGITDRTKIMYGPAGHAYIYLIYGMYYCLNFVTERQGYPAAVLIRGVDIFKEPGSGCPEPGSLNKINGPGKVCREFKIDKSLNGASLAGQELWVEDKGIIVKPSQIVRTPRIGIDYAQDYKDKLWRFVIRL